MVCYVRSRVKGFLLRRNRVLRDLTVKEVQTIDTKVKEILVRDGYLQPGQEKKEHSSVDKAIDKYMKEKGQDNDIIRYFESYFGSPNIRGDGGGPPSPFGQLEDPRRKKRAIEELLAEEEPILATPPQ